MHSRLEQIQDLVVPKMSQDLRGTWDIFLPAVESVRPPQGPAIQRSILAQERLVGLRVWASAAKPARKRPSLVLGLRRKESEVTVICHEAIREKYGAAVLGAQLLAVKGCWQRADGVCFSSPATLKTAAT